MSPLIDPVKLKSIQMKYINDYSTANIFIINDRHVVGGMYLSNQCPRFNRTSRSENACMGVIRRILQIHA